MGQLGTSAFVEFFSVTSIKESISGDSVTVFCIRRGVAPHPFSLALYSSCTFFKNHVLSYNQKYAFTVGAFAVGGAGVPPKCLRDARVYELN